MSKISNSLNNFRQLKEDINTLNVKSMSENEAQEFARNKEALIYIENYINLLDENLLPNAFFGEFQNCFVNWNRSMGHLTAIIDNALTILARYSTIYIPKNQAKPIVMEMIAGYNDAIKTSLDDLKLDEIKDKFNEEKKKLENELSELMDFEKSISRWLEDKYDRVIYDLKKDNEFSEEELNRLNQIFNAYSEANKNQFVLRRKAVENNVEDLYVHYRETIRVQEMQIEELQNKFRKLNAEE